jgi:hypothetical protein
VVEVAALQQVEAAQGFAGLREGAVGEEDLAVADPHGGGGAGGVEGLAAEEAALRLAVGVEGEVAPHHLLELRGALGAVFHVVDEGQVLHVVLLRRGRAR